MGDFLNDDIDSTGTIESYEMDLLHRDDDDSDDDGDGDEEEDDVVSQFSFREYCTQLRNNNPAVLPPPAPWNSVQNSPPFGRISTYSTCRCPNPECAIHQAYCIECE
jgi:hypothetical protein